MLALTRGEGRRTRWGLIAVREVVPRNGTTRAEVTDKRGVAVKTVSRGGLTDGRTLGRLSPVIR